MGAEKRMIYILTTEGTKCRNLANPMLLTTYFIVGKGWIPVHATR